MTYSLTFRLPKTGLGKLAKQIAFVATLAASPSLLHAVNLVNGSVPAQMDAGNSTYTLNNGFAKTFTGYEVSVGQYWSNNNTFSIIEGASATLHDAPVNIGYLADNNSMTVSGAGSKWVSTWTGWGDSSTIFVGFGGNSNTLTISNGGSVKSTHFMIGAGNTEENAEANGNTITVTGSNSILDASSNVRVGYQNANNNQLNVNDGATFKSTNFYVGSENAINSSATIDGAGTTWTNRNDLQVGTLFADTSSLTISGGAKATSGFGDGITNAKTNIGTWGSTDSQIVISGEQSSLALRSDLAIGDANGATNSVLRIEDGGLLKLGDSTKTGILTFGTGSDSVIRIDDGFFAWYGDQVTTLETFILGGRFEIWDAENSDWIAGSLDNLFLRYVIGTGETETNGLYSDLNGYTIITTIPEPSTWALVALSAAGLVFARFRRQVKA